MKAEIRRADPSRESLTHENCCILELANDPSDPDVSIARARVLPAVTTEWHRVKDIDERYVIVRGKGEVEVGDEDLVFLAVCSPRFVQSAYVRGR